MSAKTILWMMVCGLVLLAVPAGAWANTAEADGSTGVEEPAEKVAPAPVTGTWKMRAMSSTDGEPEPLPWTPPNEGDTSLR